METKWGGKFNYSWMLGLSAAVDPAPGPVHFKSRKTAFANFKQPILSKLMCDDRNSFKGIMTDVMGSNVHCN